MNIATFLSVTAVALTIGAGTLVAQPVPDSPGPAIGAKVPDFQLADQNGASRSLESVMGPKGLMLVFFRSADW